MPIERPLIDPRLLDSLGNRFNKTCSFFAKTGRGPTGGVSRDTSPVDGLQQIPCRVGRPSGSERRRPQGDVAIRVQAILLKGHYIGIKATMEAHVGDDVYNVLAVLHDGEDAVTEVQVEVATS